MSTLIIAGGGKFGKKALDFGIKNGYKIIIIDNNPKCFCSDYATRKFEKVDNFYSKMEKIETGEVFLLIHDISIINELLVKVKPEYVIPVIPIHLSALIIEIFLREEANINLKSDEDLTIKFANSVSEELLLTHSLEQGVAYLSHAKIDEVCPDNCFGPENYCPNFNREKSLTITRYLKNYYKVYNNFIILEENIPRIIIIIESHQLSPGLGGLKVEDINHILKNLEEKLDIISNEEFNLIIATTCNCHGVVNFFRNFIR